MTWDDAIIWAGIAYTVSGCIPWSMHMRDAFDSVESDTVAMILLVWALTAPLGAFAPFMLWAAHLAP